MLREASKLLRHTLNSTTDPTAISFKPEVRNALATRDLAEVESHAKPKSGRLLKEHRARPSEERPAPIMDRMAHIALRNSTANNKDSETSPGKEGADPDISPKLSQTHSPVQVPDNYSPVRESHKHHQKEGSDSHEKEEDNGSDKREEAKESDEDGKDWKASEESEETHTDDHKKQFSNPYKASSTDGAKFEVKPQSGIGAVQHRVESAKLATDVRQLKKRTFRSSQDATNFTHLLDVCKTYPSKGLHATAEALLGASGEFRTEQAEETIQFEVLTDRACDVLRIHSMRSRRCSFSFGPHYLLATGVRAATTWVVESSWRKSYPFSDHSIMTGELEKCETLLGEAQLDMAKQYLPGKMSESLAKLHLQTPSGSPVFRLPSKRGHHGRANRRMMETAFRLCKRPLRDTITAFDLETTLKRASVIDSGASSRRLFDIASSLDADSTGFLEYNEFYLFCHYITAIQVRKMTILSCHGYLLLGSSWTPVVIDLDYYDRVLSIYTDPALFKESPLDRLEAPREKEEVQKSSGKHSKKKKHHSSGKQPHAISGHVDKVHAEHKKSHQHGEYRDKKLETEHPSKDDEAMTKQEKKEKRMKERPTAKSTPNGPDMTLEELVDERKTRLMTAYEREKHEELIAALQAAEEARTDFLPDTSNINDPDREAQSSKVRHEQKDKGLPIVEFDIVETKKKKDGGKYEERQRKVEVYETNEDGERVKKGEVKGEKKQKKVKEEHRDGKKDEKVELHEKTKLKRGAHEHQRGDESEEGDAPTHSEPTQSSSSSSQKAQEKQAQHQTEQTQQHNDQNHQQSEQTQPHHHHHHIPHHPHHPHHPHLHHKKEDASSPSGDDEHHKHHIHIPHHPHPPHIPHHIGKHKHDSNGAIKPSHYQKQQVKFEDTEKSESKSSGNGHRIWDIRHAAAFDRDEIEHRVVFTLELHKDDGGQELSMVVGDSDVADFGDGLRYLMTCWEYEKADREDVDDLLLGQLARTAVHAFFS